MRSDQKTTSSLPYPAAKLPVSFQSGRHQHTAMQQKGEAGTTHAILHGERLILDMSFYHQGTKARSIEFDLSWWPSCLVVQTLFKGRYALQLCEAPVYCAG